MLFLRQPDPKHSVLKLNDIKDLVFELNSNRPPGYRSANYSKMALIMTTALCSTIRGHDENFNDVNVAYAKRRLLRLAEAATELANRLR